MGSKLNTKRPWQNHTSRPALDLSAPSCSPSYYQPPARRVIGYSTTSDERSQGARRPRDVLVDGSKESWRGEKEGEFFFAVRGTQNQIDSEDEYWRFYSQHILRRCSGNDLAKPKAAEVVSVSRRVAKERDGQISLSAPSSRGREPPACLIFWQTQRVLLVGGVDG